MLNLPSLLGPTATRWGRGAPGPPCRACPRQGNRPGGHAHRRGDPTAGVSKPGGEVYAGNQPVPTSNGRGRRARDGRDKAVTSGPGTAKRRQPLQVIGAIAQRVGRRIRWFRVTWRSPIVDRPRGAPPVRTVPLALSGAPRGRLWIGGAGSSSLCTYTTTSVPGCQAPRRVILALPSQARCAQGRQPEGRDTPG